VGRGASFVHDLRLKPRSGNGLPVIDDILEGEDDGE
jgi:hypothetical protein